MPSGFTVPSGERWIFDPDASTTVEVGGNVVVRGVLEIKPALPGVIHALRFVGVAEQGFVGGGLDPLASDVGLWVVDAGRLDVAGSDRLDWARADGAIGQSASSVLLDAAPSGWAVGDEIVITPTEAPSVGDPSWKGFEERTIMSISGSNVVFDRGVSRPHPVVNGRWKAEVLNLTRNVRIEGTPTGRSHIFVRSTQPSTLKNATIRYMGPRKITSSTRSGYTDSVLGRYALHFHKAADGSRGSLVDGVVIRDTGGHAFVPHSSHGITFRDTIAYNTMEDAYWWDGMPDGQTENVIGGDATNDTLFDRAVAAKVSASPDFEGPAVTLACFNLGDGSGNVIRNSVAVGNQVATASASGFKWPEAAGDSVWGFTDNIAHNNRTHGIWIWQVSNATHPIVRPVVYHNGDVGIFNGAYGQNYQYSDGWSYGNAGGQLLGWGGPFVPSDGAASPAQRYDRMVFDAAGQSDYAVILAGAGIPPEPYQYGKAAVIRDSTFAGYRVAGVKWTFDFHDFGPNPQLWELINNTWTDPNTARDFTVTNDIHSLSRLHVSDARHGDMTLRRYDQPGTLVPEWNARRS